MEDLAYAFKEYRSKEKHHFPSGQTNVICDQMPLTRKLWQKIFMFLEYSSLGPCRRVCCTFKEDLHDRYAECKRIYDSLEDRFAADFCKPISYIVVASNGNNSQIGECTHFALDETSWRLKVIFKVFPPLVTVNTWFERDLPITWSFSTGFYNFVLKVDMTRAQFHVLDVENMHEKQYESFIPVMDVFFKRHRAHTSAVAENMLIYSSIKQKHFYRIKELHVVNWKVHTRNVDVDSSVDI